MRPEHVALLLAAAVFAACDGFDPALYRRALAARASDACVQEDLPVLGSSTEFAALDLELLEDHFRVERCAEGGAAGNDAFFAVDMAEGQKFHFHVNALDAIDPVVYVVDSCDERVCQPLHAASACASDKEHLSFVAPRAGRYYVGVDSADPGGGKVELLAISPVCGDGDKQHSEACDDGNLEPGDGCDPRCRIEIHESGSAALEPNDGLADGNVLALPPPPARFRVRGTLDGACDPEVFSFRVEEGTRLSVRMLDEGGSPCRAIHPELQVELQLFAGFSPAAQGAPEAGNACPAILEFTAAAAASTWSESWDGTHHVQLLARGPSNAPPLSFTLELELAPP